MSVVVDEKRLGKMKAREKEDECESRKEMEGGRKR